jgi:hypothetical protein
MIHYCSPRLILGWIWLFLIPCCWFSTYNCCFAAAATFQFDKDTNDDCSNITNSCTTNPTTYFACPITCSKRLELVGYMGQANEPDDFYALSVTTSQGKIVPLENYEGYVVLYAVVPLLKDSGMAQYYYELLEHVQSTIFKYTIEIVLLPVQVGEPV